MHNNTFSIQRRKDGRNYYYYTIVAIYALALFLACFKAEADTVDFVGNHVIVTTKDKVCVTEVTKELEKNDVNAIIKRVKEHARCTKKRN